MKIAVVTTGGTLQRDVRDAVLRLVSTSYANKAEVVFHPQCFASHGHFAGEDGERLKAFVEASNDPTFDVVWFGRGGHGTCRIASEAVTMLGDVARKKIFMGYSDCGYLLAALYKNKIGKVFHGSMPCDITHENGVSAVCRSLDFFLTQDKSGFEPSVLGAGPTVALNMTILSQMIGTPMQPDLSGHVVMLEEVGEYMYRIDRTMGHIVLSGVLDRATGLRLGRCTNIPQNDPDFQQTEEEVVRYWCKRANIPYLGRADIGHDGENKIVPFG